MPGATKVLPMNKVAEYRFLLGMYVRQMAERGMTHDLSKILQRLDELWDSMTEEEHRRIWK